MTAVSLLQSFPLSITKSRVALLTVFLETNTPISIPLLLKKNLNFDRVTLHRTLKLFSKKGILHIIPSSDHSIFYKLKIPSLSTVNDLHSGHPHFICDTCQSTLCLEIKSTPTFELPPGYKMERMDIVINGKCDHCRGIV